jgi:hypothetical protein
LRLEEVVALMHPIMVNEELDGFELVDFLAVFEANIAYEWLHQQLVALDLGTPIEFGRLLALDSDCPLPLMASVNWTLIENVEHVDPLEVNQAVLYFKSGGRFVVLFVLFECFLGRLNLVYHQSCLHVALKGVNAPSVFV